tara:strand:+ start:1022 stop:2032 length:1011 start_codon:yes stop_codon:yes gene_type:complete
MSYGIRKFPATRMRRLRMKPFLRNLVSEHSFSSNDFIWPVFLVEGNNIQQSIKSMPDVYRYSIDVLLKVLENQIKLGLKAIALFPNIEPSLKDETGSVGYDPNNLICRAIKSLKNIYPDLGIITDIALDPFTSHGHDGIMIEGEILNDKTLSVLKKQAMVYAEAGCDILSPSDMMDGRVGCIRETLEENGMSNTVIMSYAAKYASSFYGPFREAIKSQQMIGVADKKTYQMNCTNSDEAMNEIGLDIREGADMIIIKPGMPYLDIISRSKKEFRVPTFAYQVSGEYSMIVFAAKSNIIHLEDAIIESIFCFKRAGADGIISYFTPYLLDYLNKSFK